MERPMSTTTLTQTTHKRAASSKTDLAQTAQHHNNNRPSTISLFVKNVRLLNLDLLDDWPVVTPTSLGNHDARTRIRNAEWSLYHLFRLYDQAVTTDKLKPFFPPLEPLQSINLRAAIYRCLNDLKKNGVLGREIVLRKSMLDECQGDKFWELCLNFSTIVLRKVTVDHNNGFGKPIAEKLGSATSLNRSQRDSMLPLSIAHRAALSKILDDKERKRHSFAQLSNLYDKKEKELQVRKARAQQWLRSGQAIIQAEKGQVAQETLDKHWTGTNELREALVKGDELADGDEFLTRPFKEAWTTLENGQLALLNENSITGVLADLENRAVHQRQRLQKWQTFHEELVRSKPSTARSSVVTAPDVSTIFDRHQQLNVSDYNEKPPTSPARPEPTAVVSRYEDILAAMREELRKQSQAGRRNSSAPEQIVLPKRPPIRVQSGSIDNANAANGAATITRPHHARKPSQTAVPFRPMLGRPISARSRSYQQPKVINQRAPIPFKSEIFSPLKPRNGSDPFLNGSVVAPPIDGAPTAATVDSLIAEATARSRANSEVSMPQSEANPTARTSSRLSHQSTSSTSVIGKIGTDYPDSAIDVSSRPTSLALKTVDSINRPTRPVSLSERTRMSMVSRSIDDTNTITRFSNESPPPHVTPPVLEDASTMQQAASLLDRTRQSISLIPASSPPPVSQPRFRPQYPINQFVTPQKPSTTFQSHNDSAENSPTDTNNPLPSALHASDRTQGHPHRRDITPREKLFAQDAEYASVFKARPKIALSPIISPYTATDDNDQVGGEGGEGDASAFDLDGGRSPLAGMSGR